MTIHFTLPGLFGNHDLSASFLQGALQPGADLPLVLARDYGLAPVTEHRKVHYLNWFPLWPGGISGATSALEKALLAAPKGEQLLVSAHSMGAAGVLTLLDKWERQATLPIDPNRVLFITMGASWSTKLSWNVRKRYRILDVTVQWEKYADYPDLASSPTYPLAKANCEKGDQGTLLHTHGYKGIDLDGPHVESTVGNTRFMLFDTHPEPLIDASREQIEAAYVRPHLR